MTQLVATALTTVASLADELGLSGELPTTRLARVVMAASARVARYLDRAVHYDASVVEALPATGGPLLLSRAPVLSIASVEHSTDGGTTRETIDPSAYALKNDPGALVGVLQRVGGGWGYSGARAGAEGDPLPGTERPVYWVTYAGGWVTPGQETSELARTLPYDIEGAVLDIAVDAWRDRGRDKSIVKRSTLGASVTYATGQGSGLPANVREVLDPYRRLAI